MSETSEGTLLGGQVRYRQPMQGFRSGIEPVLLAAAVPASAGSRVLEGGTGAGAGLLCLAARVGGIRGVGVEPDPSLAALARDNLRANGFGGIEVRQADIGAPGLFQSAFNPAECAPGNREKFAHAFANPPWHGGTGTPPLHPARAGAKRGRESLPTWIAALASRLEPKGTLTLVLPAALVPEALAGAMHTNCGSAALLPLWPRHGRPARLVLLQMRSGGRAPFRLLSGLVLHRPDGRFTAEAEAVLRGGEALEQIAPRIARHRSRIA